MKYETDQCGIHDNRQKPRTVRSAVLSFDEMKFFF